MFVYILLTRVSGIPMLEKLADERWGAEASYQRYKAATPILFANPLTLLTSAVGSKSA